MDFGVAPAVQRAIARLVEERDYGYPERVGQERLEVAFADRMRERFGWEVDPERVQPVADLVQAMTAAVVAFSRPGEGVVVQTPIYPPFLSTVEATGRRLVDNPLVEEKGRLVVDVAGLRQAVDRETRLILLCSPHNPSGRVLEREELEALGRLALERDLVIVSDEIHADLVYPGHRHLPTASVDPEVAARTVTLYSATKSFNIAGLRCAVMHFGSEDLHRRFRQAIPDRLLGTVGVVGLDATVAAWREGQPWLDRVMERLQINRDRVAAWATELGVRHHPPEATYLAWLDFRPLGLSACAGEFFLREAKVALSGGEDFGPGGQGHARLNFATSPEILEEVLERMSAALARLSGSG